MLREGLTSKTSKTVQCMVYVCSGVSAVTVEVWQRCFSLPWFLTTPMIAQKPTAVKQMINQFCLNEILCTCTDLLIFRNIATERESYLSDASPTNQNPGEKCEVHSAPSAADDTEHLFQMCQVSRTMSNSKTEAGGGRLFWGGSLFKSSLRKTSSCVAIGSRWNHDKGISASEKSRPCQSWLSTLIHSEPVFFNPQVVKFVFESCGVYFQKTNLFFRSSTISSLTKNMRCYTASSQKSPAPTGKDFFWSRRGLSQKKKPTSKSW